MKNYIGSLIAFIAGIGVGCAGTLIFTKKKNQAMVNAAIAKARETIDTNPPSVPAEEETKQEPVQESEIAVVKQESERAVQTIKTETTSIENQLQKQAAITARDKGSIVDYTKLIKEQKYVPEEPLDQPVLNYPYLITDGMIPFGQKEGPNGVPYDVITLYYYDDGIIADTGDEIIDNFDEIVGNDALAHFGDYPNKSSVYVRNDKLCTDFEICESNLSWEEDILTMKPYLRN